MNTWQQGLAPELRRKATDVGGLDEEDIRRAALSAHLTKACGARVEALGVGSWVARPGDRGQRSDETIMCASSIARDKASWLLTAKGIVFLGARDLMAWLAYPRGAS